MIISASRRTDIPAFYSKWLINRLEEGYALIPNPRNPNRLGRVELSPDKVDCIVFWTKNPIPMFDRLQQLDEMGYPFYFQFTLTPYDRNIESGLPKKEELVQAFIELSKIIGVHRLVWRYDPIFIDSEHSIEWQVNNFAGMCEQLHSRTNRCIISFMDVYQCNQRYFCTMTGEEILKIAGEFSKVAKQFNMPLYTCAEEIDLAAYGIGHSSCVDKELIEQIIGCRITAKKDVNQRSTCDCIESVDIGVYDTCTHGCSYCYATSSQKTATRRTKAHDPNAPMITGFPRGSEIITDRTIASQKIAQLNLFDI